ncbi:MAG TPA: acylphosphatase [Dehalococcoidia bacterium]|nr:acylphosphatase [Dehalococcoidia bacterium]
MTAQTSLHALVRGRVQGVGFRAFVATQARALGLSGFARNLGDPRTVEVVAEGSRGQLEALLAQLKVGPLASNVERVDASWGDATAGYNGFSAR